MSGKVSKKALLLLWCFTLVWFPMTWGCHFQMPCFYKAEPSIPSMKKMVVVGFQSAMSKGEEPGVVRDPLSGAVFMAEPVPRQVEQRMTDMLFDRLVAENRYELVSPGQAKGAFSSLVYSDQNVGMGPVEILQEVGKTFVADVVLSGYLYRWQERDGTDYGVNRPASVAFDLHLVRPSDGAILWKARFDKTQQSLSENLFDVVTFVRGGGRWMTAERLAKIGLQKLLAEMPKGPVKGGESELDSHPSY